MYCVAARVQIKSDVILELGISQDGVLVFDASFNEDEGETTEELKDLPQKWALLLLLYLLFLLGASEVDVDEALERFLAAAVTFIIVRGAKGFPGFRVKIEAIFLFLGDSYLVEDLAMLVKIEVNLAILVVWSLVSVPNLIPLGEIVA
jgi:hypothetical protein